tara:strand:- start:1272 stop:1523 length:252 start_codon:yes stop_codon:yes gene_type:complete
MKLYKISQDTNTGYDTFRSAVVVANSAEEAQNIHPGGGSGSYDVYNSWVPRPDLVEVAYLGEVEGEVDEDIYPGAVVTSCFVP